ncbi:hypothetical protein ACQ4WX_49060 [Streptomyces lasalocidi]
MNTKGYAIRSGKEWANAYDLGAGRTATAVASSGGTVYVGWCGPCNNQGFTRGIAVGNADGTGWHQLNLPVAGTLPNRYISGFEIDPADAQHVYVAINGFSRRFTEGPGAGCRPHLRVQGRRRELDGHLRQPARRPRRHGQAPPERRPRPRHRPRHLLPPRRRLELAGPGPQPAHHCRHAAAPRPRRQAVRRHPRTRHLVLRRTTPQGPQGLIATPTLRSTTTAGAAPLMGRTGRPAFGFTAPDTPRHSAAA